MSIRAQVLNLLRHLQKERGITYLFIAHDLSVMRYISDRIAVIHKGDIVELADAEELVTHAIHPYTRSRGSQIQWGLKFRPFVKNNTIRTRAIVVEQGGNVKKQRANFAKKRKRKFTFQPASLWPPARCRAPSARRIGKSTIVEEFAKNEYANN